MPKYTINENINGIIVIIGISTRSLAKKYGITPYILLDWSRRYRGRSSIKAKTTPRIVTKI